MHTSVKQQGTNLQVPSTIVKVSHVVVTHADTFFDEIGLVVVKFSLQPVMPLKGLALFLIN